MIDVHHNIDNNTGVKAVVFGGTTEGRKLCEVCATNAITVIYCVAGADGARQIEGLRNVSVRAGRMCADDMTTLLTQHKPSLVIDATHPYAEEASRNIVVACRDANIRLLRVVRESIEEHDCASFTDISDLLVWLEREPGNIIVTTGSSLAGEFTKLPDFQNRLWMRILPSIESLNACLEAGYRPDRLICMQGPFSEELNRAMFRDMDARILVTKNSGAEGGFPEKIHAAHSLGMLTAVLSKPVEADGVTLEEACMQIRNLCV